MEFEYRGGLIAAISSDNLPVCTIEESGRLFWISADCNSEDLRQIAAKLLELNGGNTLQFIEQDDGVINIKHEGGSAIGDLIKRDGMYRLTFLYTYDNADGLYQIADKLKQLNGDLDS